jgi:hypothetical protein
MSGDGIYLAGSGKIRGVQNRPANRRYGPVSTRGTYLEFYRNTGIPGIPEFRKLHKPQLRFRLFKTITLHNAKYLQSPRFSLCYLPVFSWIAGRERRFFGSTSGACGLKVRDVERGGVFRCGRLAER